MSRMRIGIGALALSGIVAMFGFVAPAVAAPQPDASAGYSTDAAPLPKPDAPPPASVQGHLDGVCEFFELCVYTGPNFQGGVITFFVAEADWRDSNAIIMLNTDESARNFDPSLTAYICTGANFSGLCGSIAPFTGGNALPQFVNNGESNYFV